MRNMNLFADKRIYDFELFKEDSEELLSEEDCDKVLALLEEMTQLEPERGSGVEIIDRKLFGNFFDATEGKVHVKFIKSNFQRITRILSKEIEEKSNRGMLFLYEQRYGALPIWTFANQYNGYVVGYCGKLIVNKEMDFDYLITILYK